MGKSELGLPLGYSELHKYYDLLSQGEGDNNAKNRLIETILKKYNVKTVLDLTCGTGSQVVWLAKHGFEVTGSDFSPALLNIAREKAEKENISVKLLEGDMRTIHVGQFDAVITIFNAIGHLTKDGFDNALKNINRNLKQGGLYLFDIFNLNSMSDAAVKDLAMDVRKTIDDVKIYNIQYSELNRDNGRLTSYDYFSIQEGEDEPAIYKDSFTLQLYTAQELRDALAKHGFETLEQCDLDGSKFIEDTSISILTVARKK